MATKKAVAKKTAVPAKKSAPSKAPAGTKASVQKMTKTQVIRFMAEQMEAPPKQIAAFFDLLIETATTQTRKNGEFTIPGLGAPGRRDEVVSFYALRRSMPLSTELAG